MIQEFMTSPIKIKAIKFKRGKHKEFIKAIEAELNTSIELIHLYKQSYQIYDTCNKRVLDDCIRTGTFFVFNIEDLPYTVNLNNINENELNNM